MFPQVSDNEDKAVALLQQIAANTGGISEINGNGNNGGGGNSSRSGQRVIDPVRYFEVETDDLDAANEDGTITLEPGDRKAIVIADQDKPTLLHGVGATDEANVTYQVRLDSRQYVGRSTNSPLGSINNPWMYPEKVGGSLPADRSVAYVAKLDQSATAPVDLAGRLVAEVL